MTDIDDFALAEAYRQVGNDRRMKRDEWHQVWRVCRSYGPVDLGIMDLIQPRQRRKTAAEYKTHITFLKARTASSPVPGGSTSGGGAPGSGGTETGSGIGGMPGASPSEMSPLSETPPPIPLPSQLP